MRKKRFWAVVARVAVAGVVMWFLAGVLGGLEPGLSIWLSSALAFALVKAAGDLVAITIFRDTVVLFFEDLIWEMGAFIILGLVAAGLILAAGRFIGGRVEPYFPALAVYFVYLLAENRQRAGADRG